MTSERTGDRPALDASSAFVSSSRASLAQAASAVVLSGVSYVVLLLIHDRLGSSLSYRRTFFVEWTQYVCVLLAFWAVCMLFTKWLRSRRLAQSLAKSPVPASDALSTDEGAQELIGSFRNTAKLSGDDLLASRAERLIQEFRLTGDPMMVTAALALESEAAYSALESNYAPVRIFSWTIPVLGFVGTVLGIGQALGNFAVFLATSAQATDEIRPALTRATTGLASAFETTLLAVLLTVIVTALYLLLHQREQTLLRAVDEICRSRLLPLMLGSKVTVGSKVMNNSEAIEGNKTLASESNIASLERSERDARWLSELDRAGTELTEAHGQSIELGRKFLEQGRASSQDAARLLNATSELLTAQRETLEAMLERLRSTARAESERPGHPGRRESRTETADQLETFAGAYTGNGHLRDSGQVAAQPDMEFARPSLEELRETIREVSPVLRRLAEHLRKHAEGASHPISIQFPSARGS